MKKLFVLFVILITVLLTYTVMAQEFGSLRRGYEPTFPEKIDNPLADPLAAGTYTVGNGGDYATLQSAFDKLSTDGVAGQVIFELINSVYVAPMVDYGFLLNGPIPGASLSNKVIIRPAANKNVTIMGNRQIVLFFLNTSYLTLDGVATEGPTTLTIRAMKNEQFPYNDCIHFLNNSDFNVIQNVTFITDDYIDRGYGIVLWNQTGSYAKPDNNLIQNNFVKQAAAGILILGFGVANTRPDGNIIRGNKIGSATDNLITWGIQSEVTLNTIIEKNYIQNIRYYGNYGSVGINAYGGYGNIIRNNVVHNISASGGDLGGTGILLSGWPADMGSNSVVYNNMVYDINSSSTVSGARVAGIQMWYQYYPRIYFNTVYLDGLGEGANQDGSGALYIHDGCSNIVAKNNILVNTRDESPYCASSIYIYGYSNVLTSDHNDLYYVQNPNNCLVRSTGGDYFNLAEWQATGQDVNSISEMAPFTLPDLHIDWEVYSLLDGHATPIWGITKDIDDEPRNIVTPDIGADEYVFVPVELTSFTAMVNGKEILLSWSTASELNNLGFEIQRSTGGEEFFTIGFVDGHGTTTEQQNYSFADKKLDNGKYYYRLKQVDFNGTYDFSEIVEVEWRAFNSYLLEQNYPNPFNPTTTIGFGIKEKNQVKITVLNAIGEEVAIVLNEEREPGFHQIEFSANNLPSGVYFYRLQAGTFTEVKKMMLMK